MTIKVGDKVRLNPDSFWTSTKSIRRANRGELATVVEVSAGGSKVTADWEDGDRTRFDVQHWAAPKPKPLTTREKLLKQVKDDRRRIEREMIEATEQIKKHQKTIEEAVPKLEEYDGIISDLS